MTENRLELVTQIVANYVSKNSVAASDLPAFIQTIHKTLNTLGEAPAEETSERPAPAVSIKRSVQPDHIVSLFDGRKLKSMKRYLATKHGMTPDEYRAYWSLPRDYPMVAPNYSAARSEMAKSSGLGNKASVKPPVKAKSKAKAAAS